MVPGRSSPRLNRLLFVASARVKDITFGSWYVGCEIGSELGLPWSFLSLHVSLIREKPLRLRMQRNSARRAATTAAATHPLVMPATCALLSLEVPVDVPFAMLEGVGTRLALVLVDSAGTDVGVDVGDVNVMDIELEVLFELRVRVCVGSGATTIEPELTIKVAISVACVSGAALVMLLHMSYALVTAAAVQLVSSTHNHHIPSSLKRCHYSHPKSIPWHLLMLFSATMHSVAPSPIVYPDEPVFWQRHSNEGELPQAVVLKF